MAGPGRAVRADTLLEPQAHLADLGVVDLDRGEVGSLEPAPESRLDTADTEYAALAETGLSPYLVQQDVVLVGPTSVEPAVEAVETAPCHPGKRS